VLEKLAQWVGAPKSWTGNEPLPGGDFGDYDFRGLLEEMEQQFPRLPGAWMRRILRRHGTHARAIIGGAQDEAGLGERFGGGLYECELKYLVANEWATDAEDVLWRRTKCGLHMTEAERRHVAEWFGTNVT
jgi:glycerol-3-phosphate dehydrogenase